MNLEKFFMVMDMNKQYKPIHSKRKKHRKIILFIFIVAVIFSYEVKEWINRRNIMLEMSNPIIVEFPLRGEWLSPNTPGTKIPSHGTNRLGTRYAYDFIQVDWNRTGNPAYRVGLMKYLLFGVQLSDYYCWGQEIYAPCDGIVIVAEDGYIENPKTNLLGDMANAYKNAHYFDPNKDDVQAIAGNYIIIKYSEDIYAAICHLQIGSIQVSVGDTVTKGDIIGKVGHSGNSFAPHLHFQLMDSSDIVTANGVPCAFEEYEVFKNGKWERVTNSIPTSKDRIRFLQSETEIE